MLNFIIEPSTIFGIIIGLAMCLFYTVILVYPKLSFQEDIFTITLGLVYSSIITIHGWRLDPVLLFSQGIVVAILFIFAWSTLRLRAMVHVLSCTYSLEREYATDNEFF